MDKQCTKNPHEKPKIKQHVFINLSWTDVPVSWGTFPFCCFFHLKQKRVFETCETQVTHVSNRNMNRNRSENQFVLIEMAAFTAVVLQCGVYGQEYILLDDYYKHQCADNNNNNVSGKYVFILPKGKMQRYLAQTSRYF